MDVEIKHVDGVKGKGLFAKRNFKSGEVMFEEDPLVCCQFSWNKTYKYRACDHCLRPLETVQENARRLTGNPFLELPHPECCSTDPTKITTCEMCLSSEYCCVECKLAALEQYHNVLCTRSSVRNGSHPVEQLDEAWKQIHYPPETSSVMLIVRLVARILQSPDREKATREALQFCHKTCDENAELAHKLLGEKFAGQISLLHELFVRIFPPDGIEQFLTLSGFQSLLALIGTNGQGVGTSPISRWVSNVTSLDLPEQEKEALDELIDKLYEDLEAQSGSFLDNEGVALYSLQSACNHSCRPNAEPSFLHNSSKLSLVALADVPEGEEICISYLDECGLNRSRHSRSKALMENYLFGCACPKCEEQVDEPDLTSDEEPEDMSE